MDANAVGSRFAHGFVAPWRRSALGAGQRITHGLVSPRRRIAAEQNAGARVAGEVSVRHCLNRHGRPVESVVSATCVVLPTVPRFEHGHGGAAQSN